MLGARTGTNVTFRATVVTISRANGAPRTGLLLHSLSPHSILCLYATVYFPACSIHDTCDSMARLLALLSPSKRVPCVVAASAEKLARLLGRLRVHGIRCALHMAMQEREIHCTVDQDGAAAAVVKSGPTFLFLSLDPFFIYLLLRRAVAVFCLCNAQHVFDGR